MGQASAPHTDLLPLPLLEGLSPGLMPGLRACWAKPLPHLEDLSAGIQKSGRGGTIRGGSVGVVRSGAGGQPEEDEEALMSSKVHWVVASISVPGEQPGEREGNAPGGPLSAVEEMG